MRDLISKSGKEFLCVAGKRYYHDMRPHDDQVWMEDNERFAKQLKVSMDSNAKVHPKTREAALALIDMAIKLLET